TGDAGSLISSSASERSLAGETRRLVSAGAVATKPGSDEVDELVRSTTIFPLGPLVPAGQLTTMSLIRSAIPSARTSAGGFECDSAWQLETWAEATEARRVEVIRIANLNMQTFPEL